jgi:hypothetical protein
MNCDRITLHIKQIIKLGYWDSEFLTGRMTKNNPLANLVMVDDFYCVDKHIAGRIPGDRATSEGGGRKDFIFNEKIGFLYSSALRGIACRMKNFS